MNKPIRPLFQLLLLLALGAVIGLVLLYWIAWLQYPVATANRAGEQTVVQNPTDWNADGSPTLTPSATASSTATEAPTSSSTVQTEGPATRGTYYYSDYQFEYPSSWEVKVLDIQPNDYRAEFYDAKKQVVATLRCPMGDMGFEAWTFTEEHRQFTKNGRTYGVDFWLGFDKQDPEEAPSLFLVFMHLNDLAHWSGDTFEDSLKSCFISINQGLEEEAKQLYHSVR
jgi:hypothetical protein